MKNLIWLLLLSTSSAAVAAAPTTPPELSAQKLIIEPVLDGDVLGDDAWKGLSVASNFTQIRPYEGQPASQRTEVIVGFTQDALYIGIVCYDEDPSGIVIGDSRRDSNLSETDSVRVILDVFQDRQNGFVFGTTPSSVEYDGQVTNEGSGGIRNSGGGFNLNWDTTWMVKSKVGDFGWSTEMKIPFRSLRYGAQQIQSWGINFQRTIRRNNEVVYWAPLSRQHNLFRVSDAGTLTSIRPPAQRNLKITPYVLGLARSGGTLRGGTLSEEEFGVDAKWSITPSLTLDATYNTDFAQVEVDEIVVNLDRFSVFFPEKRPFFLENAGQFAVGSPQEVEMFFSRRIGVGAGGIQQPIDGGVRLSGKIGRATNVGFLHMQSEAVDGLAPQNNFTVARLNQELPNRSSIGAMFVMRQGDGSINGDEDADHNLTYAIDGRWGIGKNYNIRGYVASTETPGRRGRDHAFRLRGSYDSATWTNSMGYTKVGENFNPEVGFLRRTNYEKADFFSLYRYRPADWMGLHELRPHIVFRGFWDDQGFYESGFTHIDNHWEWRNGMEIHTGTNFTHEGIKQAFEINPGTFVLPGEYDENEVQLVFNTDEGKPISLTTRYIRGGFYGGDREGVRATLRYRQGEKFSTGLTWDHNKIDLPFVNGEFEVNVARARLSYSFTPKILLQALVQYDSRNDQLGTNIRFSWLQSANAGLYLAYNEIDDEDVGGPIKKRREFALKYSRIFDLL